MGISIEGNSASSCWRRIAKPCPRAAVVISSSCRQWNTSAANLISIKERKKKRAITNPLVSEIEE